MKNNFGKPFKYLIYAPTNPIYKIGINYFPTKRNNTLYFLYQWTKVSLCVNVCLHVCAMAHFRNLIFLILSTVFIFDGIAES